MYQKILNWLYTKAGIFFTVVNALIVFALAILLLIINVERKETLFILISVFLIGVGISSIRMAFVRSKNVKNGILHEESLNLKSRIIFTAAEILFLLAAIIFLEIATIERNGALLIPISVFLIGIGISGIVVAVATTARRVRNDAQIRQ